MRRGGVLILVVGIILGLSVLSSVALGDVTVTYYNAGGTFKQTIKSNTKADVRIDCLTGPGCTLCGACHAPEIEQENLAKFNQRSWRKHVTLYFPKQTYGLREGQRVISGGDQDYYVRQRNLLVKYDKSNKRVWTAPPGSRILKNSEGEPAFVLFSGAPIKGR